MRFQTMNSGTDKITTEPIHKKANFLRVVYFSSETSAIYFSTEFLGFHSSGQVYGNGIV